MPSGALRPCRKPGCAELVRRGFCEAHRGEHWVRYDSGRGSSTERGYNGRWRRYREVFLRQNPLCVHCLERKDVREATEIDHVTPVRGRDDPLFWEPTNHQALCRECHRAKTIEDQKRVVRFAVG